jgi:hypothetical protein
MHHIMAGVDGIDPAFEPAGEEVFHEGTAYGALFVRPADSGYRLRAEYFVKWIHRERVSRGFKGPANECKKTLLCINTSQTAPATAPALYQFPV